MAKFYPKTEYYRYTKEWSGVHAAGSQPRRITEERKIQYDFSRHILVSELIEWDIPSALRFRHRPSLAKKAVSV